MRTEVWFPRIRTNGGISRVRVSSQAMYKGADTDDFRGIGRVLREKNSLITTNIN